MKLYANPICGSYKTRKFLEMGHSLYTAQHSLTLIRSTNNKISGGAVTLSGLISTRPTAKEMEQHLATTLRDTKKFQREKDEERTDRFVLCLELN